MTVSDNTIIEEGLCDFFKSLGKKGPKVSKKVAENVIKIPKRVLDITANVASAVASRNIEAALTTLPKLNSIYHAEKGLYHGKFI